MKSIRIGGYVMNDNGEPDFLDFVRNPSSGFLSVTLPLKGEQSYALKWPDTFRHSQGSRNDHETYWKPDRASALMDGALQGGVGLRRGRNWHRPTPAQVGPNATQARARARPF